MSGILTAVVRGAIQVAPLHAITAHVPGSGKSYLIDTISSIATGRACPVTSAGSDEVETEKRLVGILLAGFPVASIDNVNGELASDLLCQAVERPSLRLRRLGTSDITEIDNTVTLFVNGNNFRVAGDMVRRSVIAQLDPGVERPELRTFRTDPVGLVLADRGRFVSAVLTIVRAYLAAGQPDPPAPLASYGPWSAFVRAPLMWLGMADPVLSMEVARQDDPELNDLREFMSSWTASFGSVGSSLTVRALAEAAEERMPTRLGEPTDFCRPELRDCLMRLASDRGVINTRRLGKWLLSHEGRPVAGQRIIRDGLTHGGVARWKIAAS